MNVLFLTIGKITSIREQGIYTDLLKQFRDRHHRVYIVNPTERKENKATDYRIEEGIHILRVKTGNLTKTNIFEKGISTLLIESLFIKAIKKHLNSIRFDLVIYSTPPITFEKVVEYVKKRDGAKAYLLLKDIFPQNAVDLNYMRKNGLLYKYFRSKERKLYQISDYIGCMSKANVEYIINNNPDINPNKIEVCPNSIMPSEVLKDESSIKAARLKYNIPLTKVVYIYGGNLGKPQGIDFLIQCLDSNKFNDKAYFIIAGSGTEYSKIKRYFDMNNPTNAKLIEYLPRQEYNLLVQSCDVGLIFLDRRFTIPNFPSRLLGYMQASMPVLAATDTNTDLRSAIEEGKFGFWCESGDILAFNKNVKTLIDDKVREDMGNNARVYLENNYTSKHTYDVIIRHFK
ncbi:glycosyltransferase WbuB [Xylanibacillus composti]|uniref:Glycosyltransferase WbuB n=1 Tax=Xylanibacillus composti TaxID=1572762 RepID=A0A8J4M3W0_9BACL|nr:glycosyltransferase family 4 protein [Xylanibacillus composti]MDT9725941.1 glycosyltransferase WbuB [Xylanibacillus composti]GIQ71254.1 glycosyltransferase WbuB [Xylanibacillus composti]